MITTMSLHILQAYVVSSGAAGWRRDEGSTIDQDGLQPLHHSHDVRHAPNNGMPQEHPLHGSEDVMS